MTWFFVLLLSALGVTADNAAESGACDLVEAMSMGAVTCEDLYGEKPSSKRAQAPTDDDQLPGGPDISNGF